MADIRTTQRIDAAFETVPRAEFMLPEHRERADENRVFPIGYGQTISQPSMVRRQLEALGPEPGDRFLEVGSGSGYVIALASCIVGPNGRVFGLERIEEIYEFGAQNLRNWSAREGAHDNVELHTAGEKLGLPEHAKKHKHFDRILVSAAADTFPEELVGQLSIGGVMVVPVKSSTPVPSKNDPSRMLEDELTVVTKTGAGADSYTSESILACSFVPLVEGGSTKANLA